MARGKPSIFVVGASGRIGEEVARGLSGRGYPVRSARWEGASRGDAPVEWVEAKLDEDGGLAEAMEGCLGVVVTAEGVERGGVGRLRAVLGAARELEVPRVVYVSDASTLGLGGGWDDELDEAHYYTPGTGGGPRAAARWWLEAELYHYVGRGMPVSTVIPGMVWGPRLEESPIGRLVGWAVRGRVPAVLRARVNVVDVRDLANTVVNALERGRPGRRYVVGGENLSLETIVGEAAARAGVRGARAVVPAATLEGAFEAIQRGREGLRARLGLRMPGGGVLDALRRFSRARGLDDRRARGELQHQSRPFLQTFEDAWGQG